MVLIWTQKILKLLSLSCYILLAPQYKFKNPCHRYVIGCPQDFPNLLTFTEFQEK